MSASNYVYCHKCREYQPIWHPDSISFFAQHAECTLGEKKRYFLNSTEVPGIGDPPPVPAVSFGEEYPEGYSCDIGPMEELAYSGPPDKIQLAGRQQKRH